jgi:predicted metal-dependent hydrolase
MYMQSNTLKIGDLCFTIRESAQRRTLEIIVDRDATLVLATPLGIPQADLEAFIEENLDWVYAKLLPKEALGHLPAPKEYVSGEGFYYLGRSYRLKIVAESHEQPPLRLYRSRFELRRDVQGKGWKHFVRWYREHLRPVLERQIAALAGRAGVHPQAVQVRDLGYRWSSCGKGGRLYFHWRAAMLPHSLIEYLAAHELAHLAERHHTEAFWQKLERVVPDYAERRRWLAENGAKYNL